VLFLDHSVESLACGGPWLLGTIVPGISRWRVLKEAETEVHGGSSRRRLYGCTVTMLHGHVQPHGGASAGADGEQPVGSVSFKTSPASGTAGPPVFEQLLLTWSQVSLVSD
jgi:hypothetical protein